MKKKFIYAAMIGSILFMIGFLAMRYFYTSSSNEREVLNMYISFLNDKKYEDIYDLLCDKSKDKISKEDFIARNKNIYDGIEANNFKLTISSIKKNGKEAVVNFDMVMNTLAGTLNFPNSMVVMKEGNKKNYSIVWDSKVMFPSLEDDNKIRVNKIKAKRGSILDRNDNALAFDGKVADVGVVPMKLGANKEESLQKISDILELSLDEIAKKLGASYVKQDMFIPLKVIAKDDKRIEGLLKIQGVMVNDKDGRVYPLAEVAAHLTGYAQNINGEELEKYKDEEYSKSSVIGKTGLEKIYEKKLRGIDGSEIYIVDKLGVRKITLLKKEAKNGLDIKLTIDSDIQILLHNQLKEDAASSVAMNSKTGEVLALVSTPSYDPNDFVMGMSNEKWKSLNEDSKKPLYNRFQSNITPGSIFKPITAAVGLDNKSIDPDENKNISGLKWQKDTSWGGYFVTRVKDYGQNSNLLNAMIYSDNIYFAKSALDIGKDVFSEKLKGLGLGETIPFEYGLSKSQLAVDNNIKTEIQLADSGYGQGEILLNPLHLAAMYTMFVNEGDMINPYLEYKPTLEPKVWKSKAISKKSSDIVLKDMVQVVENPSGTGHEAYISGLNIAGKTGTAEVKLTQQDTKGTEIGWFVAMTTNHESNLLVVAMAEDAKFKGGSHYVIPKVRKAFERLKMKN